MIRRIRERRAFTRLHREGTRVRSPALRCTMLADPSLHCPHVAYSIGRAHGSAVTRNRLRRRLQALVAERAERLAPGWYLIGADPRAAALGSAELSAELDRLVERLVAGGRRS